MQEALQIARAAGLPPGLVEWHATLGSTNQLLCERVRKGAPHGSLIAAGQQSAGRGCGAKPFFSPPEGGAYFSVLLRGCAPAPAELPVTPRAALAVRRVLLAHGVPLGVKWVNDLFRGGRKVCGILCQAVGGTDGVVVGVGLNLYPAVPPPPELTGIIGFCAGSAAALPPRCQLIGEITGELLRLCAVRGEQANAALLEEYRSASILLGRQVEYLENDCFLPALALDITPAGGLLLQTPNGTTKALTSGTVRLHSETQQTA
ncbi:MAG: biotin--[acetyl-CoA-carboxylase] ligase [Oscillospiraceae bacterium]|jgi:BirA family biotin operon repressor/biotin-[acetyl-CoA-carboxylase] ligase|nr:biotin--[acetyl-CoA-carboxylase] ligase [Oscillospiraceae bacterium]